MISSTISWLEHGRRPVVVALLAATALAGLTAVRFVILVGAMPPSEYGNYNIYALLCNLLPLVMGLGISPQYQRIAQRSGAVHVASLTTTAVLITAVATIPTFAIIMAVTLPITATSEVWVLSAFILVISASTVLTTFDSQVALGLGMRSTASIMMFLVNVGATIAIVPAWLFGGVSPITILAWWAVASAIAAIASRLALLKLKTTDQSRERQVSIREGLLSIPSQVGPWLFIFLIRYLISLNMQASAVAIFSISATIADMAFLVAVSILTYFANRVMSGSQSPDRGFLFAAPLFLGLSLLGTFAIAFLLPLIGQDGYYLSPEVTVILILSGIARLHLSAWRPRAVAQKKLHISSTAFVAVIFSLIVTMAVWRVDELWIFALFTLMGFTGVAVVQRMSLRKLEVD